MRARELPFAARLTAAVAFLLAACAALQAAFGPRSAGETLPPGRGGELPAWRRAAEGHLRLPIRHTLDPELVQATIRFGAIAAAALAVGCVCLRGRDVAGFLREVAGGAVRSVAGPWGERLRAARRWIGRHGREIALVAAAAAGFFAVYAGAGLALGERYAFRATDVLFENDTPRVVKDMAVPDAKHLRTQVHPLFVLLVNPVGSALAEIVSSPRTAAVLLNSFLGACGVALAHLFFRVRGVARPVAACLAAVFGLSASQLLFGAIPSTQSLAVASLLVTYVLFAVTLARRRPYTLAWVLAGVLALGVTTTNLVQTLACFGFAAADRRRDETGGGRAVLPRLVALVLLVLGVAAGLAVLQQRLHPTTRLFFLPGSYAGEVEHGTLVVLGQPLTVLVQLAKHVFLVDFVAPLPDVWAVLQRVFPAVTFASSWSYTAFGWAALLLWLALLAGGIRAFARSWRRRPAFPAAIALCLAFNLLLHSVYGMGEKGKIELFEFTGNFAFLVLIVASSRLVELPVRAALAWLVPLVALLAVNDALLVAELLELYRL